MEANLPGVFAAGQCAVGDTFPVAVASGYLAGTNAAIAWKTLPAFSAIDCDEVSAERERVFAPLGRPEGILLKEFESMVRQINERYWGNGLSSISKSE